MNTSLLIILSIAAILGYLFFNYIRLKRMPIQPDHEAILKLDDTNFQHQVKNGFVLVDFWASWCGPCKMMAPILNELARETEGKVRIGKINIENQNKMASAYSVRSIPTLILFRDGKEINRFVGVKSKSFLLNQLKAL
jgi:thioredoxin 1